MKALTSLVLKADGLEDADIETVRRFWRRARANSAKGSPDYNLAVRMLVDLHDPRFLAAAEEAEDHLPVGSRLRQTDAAPLAREGR